MEDLSPTRPPSVMLPPEIEERRLQESMSVRPISELDEIYDYRQSRFMQLAKPGIIAILISSIIYIIALAL